MFINHFISPKQPPTTNNGGGYFFIRGTTKHNNCKWYYSLLIDATYELQLTKELELKKYIRVKGVRF